MIDAAHHGERLDRALAALVPEFSRSYLQQLIEAGRRDAQRRAVPRARRSKVKAGDEGEIELRPTPQSQAFRPEPMALDVVFEDEHLLVINKPAGLVVHPAPGNWSGTLLNGLLARDPRAALLPRAGIVHRLDKDTSGLMVVARTRAAMDALVQRIAAREVARQYVALAHRAWGGAAVRHVDAPIGRDPRNRLRMARGRRAASRRPPTFELLQDARRRLLGARHAADRPHAPDPRAHGAHRPSAGGRRALRRRAGRRPGAAGAACLPAGFRASRHRRAARVSRAAAAGLAAGPGGLGPALQ